MEKKEIISGLKQAVERGYSLEQAKQSFLNAGYAPEDVEDSAKSMGGVLSQMPKEEKHKLFEYPEKAREEKAPATPPQEQEIRKPEEEKKPKKSIRKSIIIALAIVLISLLILLFFIIF